MNFFSRKDLLFTLGLTDSSDITESVIKRAYKDIALKTHPDKLSGLDEKEKKEKEEQFKKATEAYEELNKMNNLQGFMNFAGGGEDMSDYINMFKDVAGEFMSKYKDFSTIIRAKTTISYNDLLYKNMFDRKIEAMGIPIDVKVDCDLFPTQSIHRQFNGLKYEILLELELESDGVFNHVIKKNGTVDLLYTINISHYQFYNGSKHTITHLDGNPVSFEIKPVCAKSLKIRNKGLNGGNLIIKINVLTPKRNILKDISLEEYKQLLQILEKIEHNE